MRTKRRSHAVIGLVLVLSVLLLCAPCQGSSRDTPIYISGIEELRSQFPFLPGSGTIDDPFIIAGFVVNAGGADYGFHLENIRIPLIVEGFEVYGANAQNARGGISLVNCTSVLIRRCWVHDNRVGISLFNCHDCELRENEIVSNALGINVDFLSRGNKVIGNCFDNRRNAISGGPNTWALDGLGNCWSDFNPANHQGEYVIGPGNVDIVARELALCVCREDAEPPVITLLGPNPLLIEYGTTFADPGARAIDDTNGLVSVVVEGGPVNTHCLRSYELQYVACDSSDNCATISREVVVVDTKPPKFTSSCEPLVIDVGSPIPSTPELQAMDNYDGDLVAVADLRNVDTNKVGVYPVPYHVCDSSQNCASFLCEAQVVDRQSPTVKILGELPLQIDLDADIERKDPGAQAFDNYDGNISERIVVDYSQVDASTPGLYPIVYAVSDSSGNYARAVREVQVGTWQVLEPGSELPLSLGHHYSDGPTYIVPLSLTSEAWLQDVSSLIVLGGYLAQLANTIPTRYTSLSVRLQDASHELAYIEIPLPFRASCSETCCVAFSLWRDSAIEVLDAGRLSAFSTLATSADQSSTYQLVEAVLGSLLGDDTLWNVVVVPTLGDQGMEVQRVNVSYKLSAKSLGLAKIRAEAEVVSRCVALALESNPAVTVTLFLDLYGLIYRAELRNPSDTMNLVETYVHPGLLDNEQSE